MQIVLKTDLRAFSKGMSQLQKTQLPFAISQALTATAGHAGLAWQDEMREQLDRPTPFTVNSVGVRGARKTDLTARVYLKDVAAAYLEPFVSGGSHFLGGKRAILAPKAVPLNQYGNLPRRKIAALQARPDVFVGPVRLKSGQVVSGVWQRGPKGARRKGGVGTKGSHNIKHNEAQGLAGHNNRTTLKLLVRFSDPLTVTQHLNFRDRAEQAVREHFDTEFAKAFARAIATAK